MKIVILDGFTANPGDLEWESLAKLGDLTVFDRTSPSDVIKRCKDAEIVFTNKTPISSEDMESLSALRFIGVLATGYNVVDIKRARELKITVCNVPTYSTMSVAQNVFAHILDITNCVSHYTDEVKNGRWSACEDFCYTNTPLIELAGKQMGIVGYGSIGAQVGKIAVSFGMSVAAFTSKSEEEIAPAIKVDLDTLFATSDIVSLHCPLSEETRHIINESSLARMKKSAILINTGRGPLVDENALANALRSGEIAAAGVDVLSEEPPGDCNPLLTAPNIRITPHISWATREARKRLIDISVQNLESFLSGSPQNVVNR